MDESWFIDVHYIRLSRFMFQLNSMIYWESSGLCLSRLSTLDSSCAFRKRRTRISPREKRARSPKHG